MQYFRGMVVLALSGAAAGCSWKQTPVEVIGDSRAIGALVGSWSGQYNSTETGRSGTISFQLASERDTAYGDVLMVPTDQSAGPVNEERGPAVRAHTYGTVEPLKIRFVRLESKAVSGTLAPYKDPNCGCTLVTTFDGTFTNADTIEGTFQSRGTDFGHRPTAGRWKVTRQKSVSRVH